MEAVRARGQGTRGRSLAAELFAAVRIADAQEKGRSRGPLTLVIPAEKVSAAAAVPSSARASNASPRAAAARTAVTAVRVLPAAVCTPALSLSRAAERVRMAPSREARVGTWAAFPTPLARSALVLCARPASVHAPGCRCLPAASGAPHGTRRLSRAAPRDVHAVR